MALVRYVLAKENMLWLSGTAARNTERGRKDREILLEASKRDYDAQEQESNRSHSQAKED